LPISEGKSGNLAKVKRLGAGTNEQIRVNDLLLLALQYALDSVQDSGGPLTPFVVYESRRKRKMIKFATEISEEGEISEQGVAEARKFASELASSDTEVYALAFDGFVDIMGTHYRPAVIVECGERGDEDSIVLGQIYRPRKTLENQNWSMVQIDKDLEPLCWSWPPKPFLLSVKPNPLFKTKAAKSDSPRRKAPRF
jgi:hypothetical protein